MFQPEIQTMPISEGSETYPLPPVGKRAFASSGEPTLHDPRLQSKIEQSGLSIDSSSFTTYGSGDQYNIPGGTLNESTGSGIHLPGAAITNMHIHGKNERSIEKKYPVKMLPRLQNSSFTGRRELLDRIESLFWPKTNSKGGSDESKANPPAGRKMITLHGLAGAGKSELALQYAYTRYAQYDAIFTIEARNEVELETSTSLAVARIIDQYVSSWDSSSPGLYKRIASALHMFDALPLIEDYEGLRKEARDGPKNIERLKAWLPSDRPWLLILDGYDDPKACNIDSLLPSTGVGHVLITSKNPAVNVTDDQVAVESSLGEAESMVLLKRVAGQLSYCCQEESDCAHAKRIVESVGGLPLAISLTGAYMREKQVTFENYAQKLQLGGSRSIPESEVGPHLVDIFRSTFEKLSQNARELMQLCSFIENTNIPIKLLKGREGLYVFDWMKDSNAIEKAVIELRSFSLVSQNLRDRSLSIHSLVHDHAGSTISDQDQHRLSRRIVEMVTGAFDFGQGRDKNRWTYELSILPHASRCSNMLRSKLAPKFGPLDVETRHLTFRLAQVYSQLGHVQDVAALYELGLRDVEPQSTSDLAVVIDMMNSLGISLRLQAKYDEATEWHVRAKAFVEKASSSSDPHMGGCKRQLKALEAELHMAGILMDQSRYGDAKEELKRVLTKQQSLEQQRDIDIHDGALTLEVKTRYELGKVLQQLGELNQALEEFELVYESRKKNLGENNPLTLEAAHFIAMVQEERGQYQASLAWHQMILEKRTQYLGDGHYSTLDTMNGIASLHEREGRYDEALQIYREVKEKLEVIFLGAALDHPWLLRVRHSMADTELRLGKYAEALEGYTSVYQGFKARDMMANNAWPTQTNIARVLRDIGKYDAAFRYCDEALQGLQKESGDPAFVTVAEFCKATILERQGKFEEARELYSKIALEEERVSGPDDLDTLETRCFIYSATAKQGRYEEALQQYEQIETKLQNLPDDGKPLLVKLWASHGKADVLEQLGRCDDALALYEQVCLIRERLQLKKHPEYHRAVHGIGRVCAREGKYEEGLKHFQDAIDGWNIAFDSPNHPLIFMALEDMGNARLQQGGSLGEAYSLCQQALNGCQKMLRDLHPQTSRAKLSLSAVLSEQNRLNKASEMCAAGLRGLQAELGDNHPWTVGAKRTLASIMWKQHRYWEAYRLGKGLAAASSRALGSLAIIFLAICVWVWMNNDCVVELYARGRGRDDSAVLFLGRNLYTGACLIS